MTAGEILSHKLKAAVPAILISAVLFIALVWTDLVPDTIIEDSGLTVLTPIAIMFTVIGMGASTNPKELLHFSQPMSFSIGLNVTIGFPLNLMLSQDLIFAMVKKPKHTLLLFLIRYSYSFVFTTSE